MHPLLKRRTGKAPDAVDLSSNDRELSARLPACSACPAFCFLLGSHKTNFLVGNVTSVDDVNVRARTNMEFTQRDLSDREAIVDVKPLPEGPLGEDPTVNQLRVLGQAPSGMESMPMGGLRGINRVKVAHWDDSQSQAAWNSGPAPKLLEYRNVELPSDDAPQIGPLRSPELVEINFQIIYRGTQAMARLKNDTTDLRTI